MRGEPREATPPLTTWRLGIWAAEAGARSVQRVAVGVDRAAETGSRTPSAPRRVVMGCVCEATGGRPV